MGRWQRGAMDYDRALAEAVGRARTGLLFVGVKPEA